MYKLFLCSAIAPQNIDRTFLLGEVEEMKEDFAFWIYWGRREVLRTQ